MEEFEYSKVIASRNYQFAKSSYDMISNEALSWARWLTASLLAVNGAAAAALLNSYEKIGNPIWPAIFFIAGIVFAMFSGWLLQFFYHKQSSYSYKIMEFWSNAEISENIDKDLLKNICEPTEKLWKFSWTPPAAGWVSIVMFILGVLLLGIELSTK